MVARDYDFDKHCGELGDAPRFRLLTDEKLHRIHEASLEVLENVGVKITTEEARKLLTDAGCTVAGEDIVKIPRRVVEDAIDSAPKRIVLYDREGNESLLLEGKNAYFGLGGAALYFNDIETGERRNARIEDIALASRVADALPNIDFVVTPMFTKATPEVPQEVVSQSEFEAMVSNTTKPLLLLIENATCLGDILDMAAAVAGGAEALHKRPFIVPFLSVVSPLVYNVDTLEKLLLAADRGVPVRVGTAPLAGGTGPITMAGMVVILIVEALGGLVISQLRRPGAPIIMGNTPVVLDMKTVNSYGVPEGSILSMATVEMAHYYGIPVQNGGCFYDSMGADQQMALEEMLSAYSSILAGTNLALYLGDTEGGLGFSLEATVMGDEIIGMLRRIMRGLPVDDEALALDTIRDVGPGGNFLETDHTFKHFRKEQWQPTLLCRTTFDSWAREGSKLMGQRIKDKLGEIIQSHQPRPLPEKVKTQLSAIIERRKQSLS
ncbi:MAG: trimethylamine methyltransferase family protein [Dehalococcoidia bacterium]